jgi:acyl carrier protein
MVDSLPITPHGKLDRSALIAMSGNAVEVGVPFEPVQTPTERAVAEIWSDVMRRDRVGRLDGFLELGGNSLDAIDIASRLSVSYGIEIPIKVLFDAKSVAEVATYIDNLGRGHSKSDEIVPFPVFDRSRPIPLSYTQESLWIVNQLDPMNPAYNMLRVLELRGKLDVPCSVKA